MCIVSEISFVMLNIACEFQAAMAVKCGQDALIECKGTESNN